MDFPVEVWERIFALACTDDGETGRALSTVSRYIHATSLRYRHQSIAVKTPSHIYAFARLLDSSPPELRCVRMLAISPRPTCVFNTGTGVQILHGVGCSDLYAFSTSPEKAARRLLRTVASTLCILHLDPAALSTFNVTKDSSPIVFPSLLDLSIGGDGSATGYGLSLRTFFRACTFPALARLSIHAALPDWKFTYLRRATPALEECVLNGWMVSLELPRLIQRLLASEDEDDSEHMCSFRVVLHATRPSPCALAYVHALSVYERGLAELAELASKSGGRLVVVSH
jgi:hypothetical protein